MLNTVVLLEFSHFHISSFPISIFPVPPFRPTHVLRVSHVSARSCTCACTYVSMTYAYGESYTRLHTHIVLLLARRHRYSGAMNRFGLAMRATRVYIRANDVAARCATVARRHRYSCAMTRSAQNC